MALIIGTNCGFVTLEPSGDPEGSTNAIIDYNARATKFTSPAGATKITKVGWYCDNATEEANFEIGIYSADGEVVPGEAGTRLYVTSTNAKGTDAGWKSATVDWNISPETDYWIAVYLDNTATGTKINYEASGGSGFDSLYTVSTLPNPFGGGDLGDADGMLAIYALYETDGVIPQAYYYMN